MTPLLLGAPGNNLSLRQNRPARLDDVVFMSRSGIRPLVRADETKDQDSTWPVLSGASKTGFGRTGRFTALRLMTSVSRATVSWSRSHLRPLVRLSNVGGEP